MVWSSLRGLCSPAAVAGSCGAGGAAMAGACGGGLAAGGAVRGWRLMRTDSSPSEISSSEMPDSSSSSISFFTLRMSIRDPLEESLMLGGDQSGACALARQLVADGSQSDDAADSDVGQIRVLPKTLAREHVAQMNFDEGQLDREKGIAQGDAGMGRSEERRVG